MSTSKAQVINLQQASRHPTTYVVKSLTNRIEPKVGTRLSEAQVKQLIENKNTKVNIK